MNLSKEAHLKLLTATNGFTNTQNPNDQHPMFLILPSLNVSPKELPFHFQYQVQKLLRLAEEFSDNELRLEQ